MDKLKSVARGARVPLLALMAWAACSHADRLSAPIPPDPLCTLVALAIALVLLLAIGMRTDIRQRLRVDTTMLFRPGPALPEERGHERASGGRPPARVSMDATHDGDLPNTYGVGRMRRPLNACDWARRDMPQDAEAWTGPEVERTCTS